jgi:hypothetical protein
MAPIRGKPGPHVTPFSQNCAGIPPNSLTPRPHRVHDQEYIGNHKPSAPKILEPYLNRLPGGVAARPREDPDEDKILTAVTTTR